MEKGKILRDGEAVEIGARGFVAGTLYHVDMEQRNISRNTSKLSLLNLDE